MAHAHICLRPPGSAEGAEVRGDLWLLLSVASLPILGLQPPGSPSSRSVTKRSPEAPASAYPQTPPLLRSPQAGSSGSGENSAVGGARGIIIILEGLSIGLRRREAVLLPSL